MAFPENFYVAPAFIPVDLNDAAVTGQRIDLQTAGLATCILISGDVAAVITYTFREHTAVSGGTSQDLATVTHFWEKSSTTDAAMLSEDFMDKTAQTAAATVVTTTAHANQIVVPFAADELDIVDGFRWISVNVSDPGAASIGAGIWVLGNMRYGQAEITVTMP